MAVRVSCNDLGIANCNFAATGAAPGDVIPAVVEHVRAEHGIDMPSTEAILRGDFRTEEFFGDVDPGAALIVRRLAELLDTYPSPGPDLPAPSIGRTPNQ